MGGRGPASILRDSDSLRTRFSQAMSDMYKKEVFLYADLLSIVREVDDKVSTGKLPSRHRLERHGAIRLGTVQELRTIRRLFALFGMQPVGYYDLSIVGFPLHATAFRPLTSDALATNPFRVFTTLLRRDMLDTSIRELAEKTFTLRNLFSDRLIELIELAEKDGSLSPDEEEALLTESLNVFRWHSTATASLEDYKTLNSAHPMIADITCFPSAHINHLTPRTLDIDLVQEAMRRKGIPAKERIEGPPRRKCAILLRQTSFKALEEVVKFHDATGSLVNGYHTARFGEVEQRGAAVTRKGRELYDSLLAETNKIATERDATAAEYDVILHEVFQAYPDDWSELRAQELVLFRYKPSAKGLGQSRFADGRGVKLSWLLVLGAVEYEPITYEDFLPISAAGIFASNLEKETTTKMCETTGRRGLLEESLQTNIYDPTDLYQQMQTESLVECSRQLKLGEITMD